MFLKCKHQPAAAATEGPCPGHEGAAKLKAPETLESRERERSRGGGGRRGKRDGVRGEESRKRNLTIRLLINVLSVSTEDKEKERVIYLPRCLSFCG